MMKSKSKFHTSLAFNIISAMVLLLLVFGIVVCTVGYISFSYSFTEEYATTTYHMADTATTLINSNHIELYLKGEEPEEYLRTKEFLNAYCQNMKVSLLYVISIDTSDFSRFTSVFNLVNNAVDNTNYTPWELGYQGNTVSEEVMLKYKSIYDKSAEYETVFRTVAKGANHSHVTTLVPVKDAGGNVVSILCMQRPMRELADAMRQYLIRIAILTIVLAVLGSVLVSIYLKKHFVTPVIKVSKEATRFANENTIGKPLGEISRYSEILNLARSIDTMEAEMTKYVRNLTTVTAEKERFMTELSFAKAIQTDSLPNVFPPFPERTEFDLYASMTPAKEVGGDFYNFFMTDDDHLALVIGDVSGKGVPAALLMMVVNIIISDRTRLGGSPAEIMHFVNNSICENNKADMFVTLWLGILEISTGKITAVNAGHDDPAVYRKNGSFQLLRTDHGLVVGAFPDMKYENTEFYLHEGDALFLYTDGVTEATDKNENLFTAKRMLAALNQYKGKHPQDILTGVLNSVNEFVADAPQFDDLTMLCIEMSSSDEKSNTVQQTAET